MTDYTTLTIRELIAVKKEIDAVLETKKEDAKKEMTEMMQALGFDANDFITKVHKQKRTRRTKAEIEAARANGLAPGE